jgi:methylenetetrahydrofolate reductase (NADPH)
MRGQWVEELVTGPVFDQASESADRASLIDNVSVEITGRDAQQLLEFGDRFATGTQVNVTALGTESTAARMKAVRAIRQMRLAPTTHLAARRMTSATELAEVLAALRREYATERLFVVGGDPTDSKGPFVDALSIIDSGLLEEYGARRVSIAGYPDGHPHIDSGSLWKALEEKAFRLSDRGIAGDIITQFGFDIEPVITWIEEVRRRGITMPIRVGVPGPAGVRRLLRYAGQFGVGTSAGVARKYGFSITNLLGTAGPDKFVDELASRYDPRIHGVVRLHLYTFGGLSTTSDWLATYQAGGAR